MAKYKYMPASPNLLPPLRGSWLRFTLSVFGKARSQTSERSVVAKGVLPSEGTVNVEADSQDSLGGGSSLPAGYDTLVCLLGSPSCEYVSRTFVVPYMKVYIWHCFTFPSMSIVSKWLRSVSGMWFRKLQDCCRAVIELVLLDDDTVFTKDMVAFSGVRGIECARQWIKGKPKESVSKFICLKACAISCGVVLHPEYRLVASKCRLEAFFYH